MRMLTRLNDELFPATLGSLDDLFRTVFGRLSDFGPEWMSDRVCGKTLDVEVGEQEVVVTLPLPGCVEESIEVEMHGDILTIRAERAEEKNSDGKGQYIRRERTTMGYEESIKLSVRVKADEAKAMYEDGVLTVTLPRGDSDKTHVVKVQ